MSEDLFHGNLAPGQPPPADALNETRRGFCLCDGTEMCGRKAVSDTTADSLEPQHNVRLGVPHRPTPIYKRRRKRQATTDREEDVSTHSLRTYPVDYEYKTRLVYNLSTFYRFICLLSRR